MIRDDVEWLYSTAQSSAGTAWESAVGLMVVPHVARVCYESFRYVEEKRPRVAKAIKPSIEGEIAAARHASKLVDDNKVSIESLLGEFGRIGQKHEEQFSRASDFAYVNWGKRLVVTSRAVEYQKLASSEILNHRDIGQELGRTMVLVLNRGLGSNVRGWTRLHFPSEVDYSFNETSSNQFYATSYGSVFGAAEKDVLAAIEATLGGALLLGTVGRDAFPTSIFRAQMTTFFHAVSTITAVMALKAPQASAAYRALRAALDTEDVKWLSSQKLLRNRCMHYGIPSSLPSLAMGMSMFGIVEALTHRGFTEVRALLEASLSSLTIALREARNT